MSISITNGVAGGFFLPPEGLFFYIKTSIPVYLLYVRYYKSFLTDIIPQMWFKICVCLIPFDKTMSLSKTQCYDTWVLLIKLSCGARFCENFTVILNDINSSTNQRNSTTTCNHHVACWWLIMGPEHTRIWTLISQCVLPEYMWTMTTTLDVVTILIYFVV